MDISSKPLTEPLLLASSSPRRIEILRAMGIPFISCPADVDERVFDHLPIHVRVLELAELKARTSLASFVEKNGVDALPVFIIGADTLVSIDGMVLGKAGSEEEARKMLSMLSGRTHTVSTGLCVLDSRSRRVESVLSETHVTFTSLSSWEMDDYIGTGEWRGVAGAYRIQEQAAFFATRIEGSFSGVVGLPLHEFYAILSRSGYHFSMKEVADSVLLK